MPGNEGKGNMKKTLNVVILAAGEGTRMKSETPKVLHPVAGHPMIKWVLEAVFALHPEHVYVVVGHQSDKVKEALKDEKCTFVTQSQQLGSGHALQQVAKHLKSHHGDILVLCGDTPLVTHETLQKLIKVHHHEQNAATILSANVAHPFGYGRIYRMPSGLVYGIIEEKDATQEQKQIKEINSGIYCFSSPQIWSALKKVTPGNSKKEYYLTDTIAILAEDKGNVGAFHEAELDEILGVNTRADLSHAERVMRERILNSFMLAGVTIIDPASTYISRGVVVGRDTVIYPGTIIEGKTTIGERCHLGPYSMIQHSTIGNDTEVKYSCVTEAVLHDKVTVGPFAHLRPGTVLKQQVKVGNFSEVKKSVIEAGSKVNHLSYIGDATLGRDVNVGAGTITCNYDGVQKHKTVIGDRVFVGSNVNLVAPVTIGADALLGAGSTITDDVPVKNLAIARERQTNKTRKK